MKQIEFGPLTYYYSMILSISERFSLNVGTDIETCDAADCPTYTSVELEVPEYVHTNLVTDIPVIRNGLDDVVIASIDPEIGIVKVQTKNTYNDIDDELPLMDGDIIDMCLKA